MISIFASLFQSFLARPRPVVFRPAARLAATLTLSLTALLPAAAQTLSADRVTLVTSPASALAQTVDSGPVPGSQRLSLTLTLAPSADRTAALNRFLSDVTTSGSASYHKFLTPAQFAAYYGATSDQLAAASAWATAQGFTVDAVSPAATRLTVSAPASSVQSALAVTLHNLQLNGSLYFANVNQPSLPSSLAPLIAGIDGLSSLPAASFTVQGAAASLSSLGALVDANSSAILTLDSQLASASLSASQAAAFSLLFKQASAQGITLLAARPAVAGAFPAALAEITAIAAPGTTADATLPTLARPDWQAAPGLPADGLRHSPDLTASSLSAFAQTLTSIELQTGRQGNINRNLYELGPTPGLYTQPDAVAAGTWEAATGLGLVNLDVLAKAYPRGTTSVEVDTTASNYSPVHGSGFTLTSTVYPGAAGTPTGTITWSSPQGSFPTSTLAINNAGAAMSPTFQLAGGSYTITSSYSGDATFAAGTTTTTIYVSAEAANFTLSAPTTATLGGTLAVTATVASPSGIGIPSGTVTASVAGAPSQTMYLSGSGSSSTATFSFAVNQAGTLAIQATCTSGDQSFTCYNTPTSSTTVAKATPAVTLRLSTTTPTSGANVSFSVAVAGISAVTPTGTVTIFDNGTQIASVTLPNTSVSAPLGAGTTHSVTAQYNGDGNYTTATSAATTATSGTAATTITTSLSPLSITYGAAGTLTVTVAPSSGAQVNNSFPSGSVSVTVGGVTAQSNALSSGTVNVQVGGTLAPGTYPITIAYPGDTNYAASTATASQTLTVTAFIANVTPQLSYNMFTQGSTQTLTVQFQPATTTQVPANATFTATLNGVAYHGKFVANSGNYNATGQVTIYAPASGTYQLVTTCDANPDYTCNVNPSSITVTSTATTAGNPPTGTGTGTSPTTTVLTASTLAPAAGASITLTATVTGAASVVAVTPPTGTVSFYDGTTLLTTATLRAAGGVYSATASVTLTGTATHMLTAVYSGDTIFAASTSAAITANSAAAAAAVVLTSTSTTGAAGQAVTFTAVVTGSTSSGAVPTGSVTFYLAGTTPSALATVGLGYQGPGASVAVFTTTGLPAGSQVIYAVYSGDGNFNSVTSNSITTGLSDFSFTFSPASLSLIAGQSGTASATVTLIGGFNGTVTLLCTAPSGTGISCSFNPSSVTAGGTSTLSVTTTAPVALVRPFSWRAAAAGGISFAALLGVLLPGRRRRRMPALLLLLIALGPLPGLGCGSSGSPSSRPITGTPLGTTVLTITASGTEAGVTVRHTSSFQVTVQ